METLSYLIETEILNYNWDPIKISRAGPKLSHLLFADDLVLFAKSDTTNASTIIRIFQHLSAQSGQRINFQKSKIIFFKNVPHLRQQQLATILNMRIASAFDKYPGFPLTSLTPKSQDYQSILNRMTYRLQGWKTRFLKLAGRTTLIKSVLNSIPTHVMQLNILSPKILSNIDRIQRNFL